FLLLLTFPTRRSSDLLSSFTTQRACAATSGIKAATVFHSRFFALPTIIAPGAASNKRFSKSSRQPTRGLASPEAICFSRASRARSEEHTSELQSLAYL